MPVERAGEEEIVSAKLVIMLLVGTKEFYVQPPASYGYNDTNSILAIGHFFTRIRGLLNADGWVVLYFSTARSHNMIATNILQQRRLCGVQPPPMAN